MSALRNVDELLENVSLDDRLGYFEELPAEVRDAFWRELAAEVAGHREAERAEERDRYGWPRRPRVGRLWGVRKFPFRRRAIEGGDGGTLHLISPPEYVEALAGVPVDGPGQIPCPLPGHEDVAPSFMIYDSPERGFYCWGCHAGGDIYNFAAALWDLDTRRDFPAIRRRVAECLGEAA